jgi:cytochrome c oxidase accessory protein FixG
MALATPDEPEITRRALFKERDKVYPKSIKGRFRTLKWAALILLLSIYYITPWIRWDRGPDAPDQAILIDMTGRRAYFFFIEIWPQQVYFLTGILIVAAIGLFLATSLFGRVWCGYACPQTVWTDLFMWVERKIEGDRGDRIRLDNGKFSMAKLQKKVAKHAAWIAISLATGGAWAFYFYDAPTLMRDLVHFQVTAQATFFILLFSGFT